MLKPPFMTAGAMFSMTYSTRDDLNKDCNYNDECGITLQVGQTDVNEFRKWSAIEYAFAAYNHIIYDKDNMFNNNRYGIKKRLNNYFCFNL